MNADRPASAAILQQLRHELKRQSIRIPDLAQALGVSEPTLWRWLRGEAITLSRLEQICAFAAIDLRDLIGGAPRDEPDMFTLAQERVLAADRRLALVFFAILHGAQRTDLERDFSLSGDLLDTCLERLRRLDLVDIGVQGRLRPRTQRAVRWRRGGPLAIAFERTVKPFFLSMDFGAVQARYESEMIRLSEAGRARVQALFEALRSDLHLIADEDRAARIEPTQWTAVLMMVRPFDLGEVTSEWRK